MNGSAIHVAEMTMVLLLVGLGILDSLFIDYITMDKLNFPITIQIPWPGVVVQILNPNTRV